jgi:hypothetical protein
MVPPVGEAEQLLLLHATLPAQLAVPVASLAVHLPPLQ